MDIFKIVLIIFILSFSYAQSDFICNLTKVESYSWKNNDWSIENSTEFSFNNFFQMIEENYKVYNDVSAIPVRTQHIYDSQGNLSADLVFLKINDQWIKSDSAAYSYYSDKSLKSEEYFSFINQDWLKSIRKTYIYNIHNSIIEVLTEIGINNNWVNNSLIRNNYSLTHKITQTINSDWLSNSWYDSKRYTYTYNLVDSLNKNLIEFFDGSNWKSSRYTEYTYNSDSLSMQLVNYNFNLKWVPENKYDQKYDSNKNLIKVIKSGYDSVKSIFIFQYLWDYKYTDDLLSELSMNKWNGSYFQLQNKHFYNYNSFRQIQRELYQIADSADSLINNNLTIYFYNIVENVSENQPKNDFVVFPNPCTDIINITFFIPNSSNVIYSIYDLNMNKLFENSSFFYTGETILNLDLKKINLCSGTYYLKLNIGRRTEIVSFIKVD
ncbi:MAG: T9SS type A sorting domain-containing protein [Candidatus Kapabacteria bacterium]|nr:T9SS type A sorting domain-containing protein [Candidatus Kapabacteria bacterium]